MRSVGPPGFVLIISVGSPAVIHEQQHCYCCKCACRQTQCDEEQSSALCTGTALSILCHELMQQFACKMQNQRQKKTSG